MSDTEQTLSTSGESSDPDAVPTVPQQFVDNGDTVSTVDKQPLPIESISQAGEQNTADADKEDKDDKKAPEKEAVAGEIDDRLDKHPRFKELISEKNELRKELKEIKQRLESVDSGRQPDVKAKGKEPAPDYEDITALEDDAILDKFNENPKGFLANFARQIAHEVKTDIVTRFETEGAQREAEDRITRTFESYAEKNPDFNEMWESGKIEQFMRDNPGHNAISAHQLMTAETKQAEAIKKAVKEAEERIKKNFQAKRNAALISDSPARAGRVIDSVPAELKDPKRFGGVTSVLAQRLSARRAAGGA